MKKLFSTLTLLFFVFLCFGQNADYSVLMKNAKNYVQEKKFVYAMGTYLDAHAVGKTLEEKKLAYNNYFQIADAIAFGKPGLGEFDELSLHDEWMNLLDDFNAYWFENFPKTVYINSFEWGNIDLNEKTQKLIFGISMPDSKKYTLIKAIIQRGLNKCDKKFWKDTGEIGPINMDYFINDVWSSSWWNDEKYVSEDYIGVFEFFDSIGKKLLKSEIPSYHAGFKNGYEEDISNSYRSFYIDIPAEYIDLVSTVRIGDFYAARIINDTDYTKANYNKPVKIRQLNYILSIDEPDYAQFQPEEIKAILSKCSPYEAVEQLMVSLPGLDFDILATDLVFVLKNASKKEYIQLQEEELFINNLNSFVEVTNDLKSAYGIPNYSKSIPRNYNNEEGKVYNSSNEISIGKYTDYTDYFFETHGCKSREHEAAIKKPTYEGLYDFVDGDIYCQGQPHRSKMKKNHTYYSEVAFTSCPNNRITRKRITEEEKQKRIAKLKKEGDAILAVEKTEASIEEFIKSSRDNTQQVPTYYINAENISLLVDYLSTHGGTDPYVQIVMQGNIKSYEEISRAIRSSNFPICLYLYTDSNPVEIDSFNDCLKLVRINLPKNIKTIKQNAFSGCKDLLVVGGLSTNITKIEENAFLDCNNITNIWVKGTEKQWKKVKIDKKGNQSLLKATVQYYE